MSSDEAASIREVIRQERATIAYYQALLRTPAPRAQKTRWRALRGIHAGYVKKWEGELKG